MRWLVFAFLVLPPLATVHAEMLEGRISAVSKKAATIQMEIEGKGKVVVRTDPLTEYEGVSGIADLEPPDLIRVQREPGEPVNVVKKVIVGLPPGVAIDEGALLRIMISGKPYRLYDARPRKRFLVGHIPGAESAFPEDDEFLAKLPDDKSVLLVFYCGGSTCPHTGKAARKAREAGYTNVRGYQAGMPGWRKTELPLHVEADWLAKNLNTQYVILDVRDESASRRSHIKGAFALSLARLQAVAQQSARAGKPARLPGVSDRRAPIIVYADSHASREVLLAFKELRDWGYKRATVLRGGLVGWQSAGLPTETGPTPGEIVYRKKLAPGAISPTEFMALERSRDGVLIIDVRSDAEADAGMIAGARHIPLEELEDMAVELPKNSELLIYCATGVRAEMAHQTLEAMGIESRFLNETIIVDEQGGYRL